MKKLNTLFTLSFSECLMFSALLVFSTSAFSEENIGRVIHTNGKLVASNHGDNRILTRGSSINEGDVLNSGTSSRSQIRMIDGALILLRKNTEIRFDEYRYKPEKRSDSKSLFSLLRGGFNTISGLIGKHNKRNYRVNTPVATIGVRGTHYGVTLCDAGSCINESNEKIEDGLYASVIDGEIFSENDAGYFVFSNDEYFHVADIKSEPRSLIKAPGVVFGFNVADEQEIIAAMNASNSSQDGHGLSTSAALYTAANQNNKARNDLTSKPVFTAADDVNNNTYAVLSNPGAAMLFSFWEGVPGSLIPRSQTLVDDGTTNNVFALNAIAAVDNLFIPIASRITFGAGPSVRELYIANAKSSDVGSLTLANTRIGWGRWSGNQFDRVDDGTDIATTGSLHYVVADATTTPAQYGAMTGTFNYTTIDGTRATDLNGNVATSVANVGMGVDFTAQQIIAFTVNTNVAGNTYSVDLNGAGGDGATAITTAINTGMTLGTGSCGSCGGTASLALVGKKAQGAITSYNIADAFTLNAVSGTAVLKR